MKSPCSFPTCKLVDKNVVRMGCQKKNLLWYYFSVGRREGGCFEMYGATYCWRLMWKYIFCFFESRQWKILYETEMLFLFIRVAMFFSSECEEFLKTSFIFSPNYHLTWDALSSPSDALRISWLHRPQTGTQRRVSQEGSKAQHLEIPE